MAETLSGPDLLKQFTNEILTKGSKSKEPSRQEDSQGVVPVVPVSEGLEGISIEGMPLGGRGLEAGKFEEPDSGIKSRQEAVQNVPAELAGVLRGQTETPEQSASKLRKDEKGWYKWVDGKKVRQ